MRQNKMKISGRIVASFCLLVTLLFAVAGASLAWLVDMMRPSPREDFFASSIASYFAGGDGKTPETAYRIETPVHLYNLAWLQNMGQFNKPDDLIKTYYFEIANASHGAIVLDMAGKLTGADGTKTGAIPPIGTKQYPFKGVLDGKGSVIQNLWVSTHHDDWEEHPANMETYQSTHVGLFGAADAGAVITNFNVDRIEVTTHYSATVGILCGYANANISDVGVYNGILDFRNSEIEVTSDYTLLGELGENVAWGDKPTVGGGSEGDGDGDDSDNAGGDIFIDPNNVTLSEGSKTPLTDPGVGGYTVVAKTITGTAYYAGKLEVVTRPNKTPSMWTVTDSGGLQPFTATTLEDTRVWDAFVDYRDNSSYKMIAPTKAPSLVASDMVTVPCLTMDMQGNVTVQNLPIPGNCVWFKPQQAGTAALAFTKGNNSKPYFMALYQYQRDKETKKLTLVDTILFELPKVKDVGNGDVMFHTYDVEKAPETATYEYEYAIGIPEGFDNSKQFVGFFCMMLAGTNVDNGDTPGGDGGGGGSDAPTYSISDIDYIVSSGVNVGAADYAIHQVIFTLSGKTASAGKITYLAWSDGKVYYQIDPTALGLVVSDVAGNSIGASSTTNANVKFNDRQDIASASSGP